MQVKNNTYYFNKEVPSMKAFFEMIELVDDVVTASTTQGGGSQDTTDPDCGRSYEGN